MPTAKMGKGFKAYLAPRFLVSKILLSCHYFSCILSVRPKQIGEFSLLLKKARPEAVKAKMAFQIMQKKKFIIFQ